ncbi:hypothetical protein BH24GEM1_BH24GEM1_28090 [soil metagenome]
MVAYGRWAEPDRIVNPGVYLCKYTQTPAGREQATSRSRWCGSGWWGTSGCWAGVYLRVGPRPEERAEFPEPVAPPVDMEHLDVME